MKHPKTCFECIIKPKLRGQTKRQRKKIIEEYSTINIDCPTQSWTIAPNLAQQQAVCDDKTNAELEVYQ